MDGEVMDEVWQGKVPIAVRLAPDELVATTAQPPPFYMLAARISYLPLLHDALRRHFANYVDHRHADAELWLDFESAPLRPQHPIGVLYDALAPTGDSGADVPWPLTVHFTRFPTADVCRSFGAPSAGAESHYMQSLKEADFVLRRGKVVQAMERAEHKRLWNAVLTGDRELFRSVNGKMNGEAASGDMRLVPLRFYTAGGQRYSQAPVEFGRNHQLLHAAEKALGRALPADCRLVVHGVDVPADVSVDWLLFNMAYPDNFVRVCVR